MFEVRRLERLESNSGFEKHEDLLPFPNFESNSSLEKPSISSLRQNIEPDTDLEMHEALLPFPLAPLGERVGVRGRLLILI
jgi:hypothetical protein